MSKPPLIRAVRVTGATRLEIDWSTGETLPVSVKQPLARYKLYAPLRKASLFQRVKPDRFGHSLEWPGGLDMGADDLYQLSREQAGEWGPETFAAWMDRNGLSLTTAAAALGMTRRMMAHYRTGSRPIPRVVALACEGWELHKAA